jgi:hypothetical protein
VTKVDTEKQKANVEAIVFEEVNFKINS